MMESPLVHLLYNYFSDVEWVELSKRIDLSEFANENALCAWAGVAPGNNQSAGKRYSGKS